jgi:hypothetical protein
MRFMVIVKANPETESGRVPTSEEIAEMGKYNDQLANAGVLLTADGLHASSKGARVRFGGAMPTVTDGPFTETKELIAGFWIIQAKSKDEAIEWVKRAPMPAGAELEVRQVFEAEDFGDALTPDLRERQDRTWAQVNKS